MKTVESSATPKDPVPGISLENPVVSEPVDLAKTVQGEVVSRARGRRWKWTKAKKEALRLVLGGAAIVDVAAKVGAHRNTIMGWAKAPEWTAEAQHLLNERQVSSRLRRLTVTGAITDKLAAHALRALEGKEVRDPAKAGLVLREHVNYVKAERALYGEEEGSNGPPGAGGVHIHLGAPGQPQPVAPGQQATAVLSFKEFMAKYDPSFAVAAHSPQEAVLLIAEKAMQESNLLDVVREEDRETMRLEAEAAESAKRRR